jgi:hypothetical protein
MSAFSAIRWRVALISLLYSSGQIVIGLLLHPYQTMQSVVRDKVFMWLALSPMVVLGGITVLWRFMIVPIVRLVFSCQASGFWGCEVLPFISNWITFFCIYWQVLLVYLLVRFSWVFNRVD